MSAAEWISATTSVAALGAAVWAGVTARNVYRIESERDHIAAQARERAVAAKVSAWTVYAPDLADGAPRQGILISNQAPTAITDIVIESSDRHGRALPSVKAQVLPPGDYFVRATGDQYHWAFPEERDEIRTRLRPVTKHEMWQVSETQFTDSEGIRWRRDKRGKLTKIQA